MSTINGHEIDSKTLLSIFEREGEKVRIKLTYNYAKLLEGIIKCRKDFNIPKILEKSNEELEEVLAGLEKPTLDRSSKNNLSFTERQKEIPKEFKNKIKIEL